MAVIAVLGTPGSSDAAQQPLRSLTYGGIYFSAPRRWPVYDLRSDTSRCARLDVHAVYLGHQGRYARCPTTARGRTASVHVESLDRIAVRGLVFQRQTATLEGERPHLTTDVAATRTLTAALPDFGVVVTIPYGNDRRLASRILRSFRLRSERSASPKAQHRIQTLVSRRGRVTRARLQSRALGVFQGQGFDACAAPALETMSAWLRSPYRVVGVYIGGAARACSQPNLSAEWVNKTQAQGWKIIPTYVGLQAPCSDFVAKIDPASAGAQGTQAADDAIVQATNLGFGAGDPIYFDMEHHSISDPGCADAVKAFLEAWTKQLHAKGWTSGVYGSASSTGKLLADAHGSAYTEPDNIWYANWDERNVVNGDPFVPDGLWSNHQRIHQYRGGHMETWGGATINIDNNAVDGAVAQAAPPAQTQPPESQTPDRRAPLVKFRRARQHLKAIRRQGLRLRVRCSETCTAVALLGISRNTARRLGFRHPKGPVLIGAGTALLAPNRFAVVRVKLTRAARRRLRGRVRVQLAAIATDAAGNRTPMARRYVLRP